MCIVWYCETWFQCSTYTLFFLLLLFWQRIHSLGARKFVLLGTGPVGCCPARRNDKTGECNEKGNSISAKYSDGLKSMIQQLKPALGINYSFFETYGILRNIVQNPSSYGTHIAPLQYIGLTYMLDNHHRLKSCLALYAVLKADRRIITKFASSYVSGFNETKAACCGLGYLNAKAPCLPVSSYCSNRRDHVFWDFYHPTEATHRILVEHLFQGSTYTVPMNVEELVSL